MTTDMKASHKQGRGITYRKSLCFSRQARACGGPRSRPSPTGQAQFFLPSSRIPACAGSGSLAPPVPSAARHPDTDPGWPTRKLLGVAGLCAHRLAEGTWGTPADSPAQPGPT